MRRTYEMVWRNVRVEICYGGVVALWKWDKLMTCALDDGKRY